MNKRKGLRVFAPASVANVAVGYDVLGFALDKPGDELVVREGSKPGLVIKSIHGNSGLSKEIHKNTAGYAAFRLMESLGYEKEAVEIELYKKMGIGTGLGSSAASAVAGVFAVNEFFGRPYSKDQLLRFATDAEQIADGSWHADNVAPSLLGSIILIRDNASMDYVKLPVPDGLRVVILYPKISVLTKKSRAILKQEISLDLHIKQGANLGAFVAALYKSDLALMSRSLTDHIIEPQRAGLIPHFAALKALAMESHALACSISGAGPSIFALTDNTVKADNILNVWTRFMSDKAMDFDVFISKINTEGAKVF